MRDENKVKFILMKIKRTHFLLLYREFLWVQAVCIIGRAMIGELIKMWKTKRV